MPSGKTGRVFTTTHGASEDLLNEGFRRMAVNAVPVGRRPRGGDRADGDIGFVGPYQAIDLQLRRLREGREAGRPRRLGFADHAEAAVSRVFFT